MAIDYGQLWGILGLIGTVGFGLYAISVSRRSAQEARGLLAELKSETAHNFARLRAAVENVTSPHRFESPLPEELAPSATEEAEGGAIESEASEALVVELQRFRLTPAHYLILDAVQRRSVRNIEKLRQEADRYNLPQGWEKGVDNLLSVGLLVGGPEALSVNPRYAKPLYSWLRKNEPTLRALASHYAAHPSGNVSVGERDLVRKLDFSV